MRYGTIVGIGHYLPEQELSNEAMKQRMEGLKPGLGQVIDKFEESSGIRTRWLAPRDWTTSDLAVEAGRAALADAGIRAEDLDMILLGTDTPDYVTPATSTVVQARCAAGEKTAEESRYTT